MEQTKKREKKREKKKTGINESGFSIYKYMILIFIGCMAGGLPLSVMNQPDQVLPDMELEGLV